MPAVLYAVAVIVAAVSTFAGRWEMQTMGADRELSIEQRGTTLVIHRIMWPEFEGKKYKLEHLYRGKLKGNKISGNLLVREEGQKSYEMLRPFAGETTSGGGISIDGIGLKRVASDESESEPKAASSAPVAEPPPSIAPPADNQSLFSNIMGTPTGKDLFNVSASVAVPQDTSKIIAEGDELYRARKYKEALAKYDVAAKQVGDGDASLLHRMGRCQLGDKRYVEAKDLLGRALRLDPQNKELKSDYETAKRKAPKAR